ncbi:MAG: SoxY-related AACIE arm protein [Alphaproteobacteria bacterium]|nr:SoxY-related AACIE arm protein [Alphaproteobacteria bacterium]
MTDENGLPVRPTRRWLLAVGGGLLAIVLVRPAAASLDSMKTAIAEFTGGRAAEPGRVTIDIPALVENGNSVPLTVKVDSPMTASDFVRRIGVFNQLNPQPYVATFHLSPRNGRAQVATRIRLGDSQTIMAIAEMSDGSFRSASADLIVTLPACVEN